MLESLKLTFHSLFLSFGLSLLFAPIMINILYRFNQVAEHKKAKLGGGMGGDNSLYLKIMNVSGKNGIPNMGGVMVWVIVPLTTLIMTEASDFKTVFLIAFLLFGLWGVLDVAFTNFIKNNPEMKTLQERFIVRLGRFLASVLINVFIMYLVKSFGLLDQVNLNFITVSYTWIALLVVAIVGQFAIYSAEITDGLDGLMIGIFGIVYTALGAVLLIQGHYTYLPIIGIIIGSILVDLYFNINPARFYNGGPSAMPLGFGAFIIALLTGNLIAYFIISSVTWGIMLSSMIQIISVRFFKKRVFKIAPIHHHFQAIGWPETKVIMRFWLATMVVSVVGIYIGIVL